MILKVESGSGRICDLLTRVGLGIPYARPSHSRSLDDAFLIFYSAGTRISISTMACKLMQRLPGRLHVLTAIMVVYAGFGQEPP